MDESQSSWQLASSDHAKSALHMVSGLQSRFVEKLEKIGGGAPQGGAFKPVSWLREEGKFGGGTRFEAPTGSIFNRGSVNVSQVQYESDPEKKLASATAISTIIHPMHPLSPSVHIHVSWTELKGGLDQPRGYWRIMADLNPSCPDADHKKRFLAALQLAAGSLYEEGCSQGDAYFFIPVLNRHRGVAHFYLEEYNQGDFEKDLAYARKLGEAAVDSYCAIFAESMTEPVAPQVDQWQAQLNYHTVYFLQVLSLDRGTTAGLMVHDQNDVGILGSLPSHVDVSLLSGWAEKLEGLQKDLVGLLVSTLKLNHSENPSLSESKIVPGMAERNRLEAETSQVVLVDEGMKKQLCKALRTFYQNHPEALHLQAAGKIIPKTIANHTV